MEEIIDIMNGNNKVYLFVYGTLMRGNRQGQMYLNDEEFKGEYTLNGFALYDLGHYPAIVKDEDGKVKGELYAIPESKLAEIDVYEAEGTLYIREMVKVYSNTYDPIEAYVYVYNQSIAGLKKVEYNSQPWNKAKSGNEDYIWYACYGSNINKERFMKYIRECSNSTPPVDEKQFIINHPIYFSSKAKSWSDKGVAFLDVSKEGLAYGRIYLITKDQFVDVKHQEGNKYNQVINLGSVDGIPVKTFTHSPRYMDDNTPSKEYIDIIKNGIKETYCNLSEIDIDVYLLESYLRLDELEVLKYLRNQAHGVSIKKISDGLNKTTRIVVELIGSLLDLKLIKQDGGNVRREIAWDSIDAIYYTIEERREAIDIVVSKKDDSLVESKVVKQMDKQTLLGKINALPSIPVQREYTIIQYDRSPYVKEYTRRRANGICELCNEPAPFNKSNGEPFLEVHHIKMVITRGK